MAYQLKKYEWDLNEEEQGKAKFIREWADKTNEELSGGKPPEILMASAHRAFKVSFYDCVQARLGIPMFEFGQFGFSDDCTKLYAYKVE